MRCLVQYIFFYIEAILNSNEALQRNHMFATAVIRLHIIIRFPRPNFAYTYLRCGRIFISLPFVAQYYGNKTLANL